MIKYFLYLLGIWQGEAELPESEYKRRDILHPGQDITYYCEYQDGCQTRHYSDGSVGYSGKQHAPHEKFHPEDKPVKEWKTE